jgi:hypothetical protein
MGEVSNSERSIYLGRSAEWLINHAVAEYKFNNIGLVSENPEDDGKSVRVWEDDIGYCGIEIGVFDYTGDLGAIPSGAVPTIFRVSNALDIPLRDMEPILQRLVASNLGVHGEEWGWDCLGKLGKI